MKLIAFWALALFATVTHANESPTSPWRFSLEFGLEDDSNVVIDDNDTNASSDNLNQQSKLSLGYSHKQGKNKLNSAVGYTYLSNDYKSLDSFDTKMHLFSFKTSKKFAELKLGLSAQWVNSSLNQQDFLQIKQMGGNASYFINKTNFVYTAINLGRKTFDQDPTRDANQRGLSANYYHLFNGLNHYITVGTKVKQERASDDAFSYDLNEVKAQYIYRRSIFSIPSKITLGYRYQNRDYDQAWHPSIDDFRKDRRQQLFATLRLQWSPRWYSELSLVSNANESNVSFADYNQTRIGFSVGFAIK